ncbi:MAG: lamin tail domain-containing protein [Verrucomicrobiales bacterium]|nr:lamin tail domain-containing protein [Verrucomicrobiales bacterium]
MQANLSFIAGRSAVVLQQLRSDGLYPTVAAPQFNQDGGPIPAGFGLLLAPGTATIYFTLDGTDPRRPGGAVSSTARRYTTPVSLAESATVKARVLDNGAWSALSSADFTVIRTFTELAITEIHYHPPGTADRDGDDFEFVELKNTGRAALDLSGVHFTNGIRFAFPNGTKLAPGAFAVLVRDAQAFRSRYPGVAVAGTFEGGLANGGEQLSLVHAVGSPLFSVTYGTRPPWPALADGEGFSLVPAGTGAPTNPNDPAQWRASSRTGGSPGADDVPAGIVPVVVNEVLTHTDPPLVDTVELHNPNDQPAPIGGWWLTDDRGTPKKYRIPAGRTVPPRGFVTFSELDFNQPGTAATNFTFSSYGDEVWLFAADAAGELTGYSDGFGFGASANAVSFGRMTNSVGAVRFPAQAENSLSLPNRGPRIGPVVINEIHYAPTGGDAPFVEVRNLANGPTPLFDPNAPTNTWKIEGIGFVFPPGVTLPAGGLAVVTATDPALFRQRHGIADTVPVLGPFPGVLQNNGETLRLERPDNPDLLPGGTWFVPYIGVDEVTYDDRAPWPVLASQGGASLERTAPVAFADDPASWKASFGEPSPGYPNDGNRAPEVSAGADREIEATLFPYDAALTGIGADDGLPLVPGKTSFTWTQVGGPGPVAFVDPTRTNGLVRLPGLGTYVLRLTANDGDRSRSDEVTLRVRRPSENAVLVAAGSTWRYLDNGSDQGSAWRAPTFADTSWSSGKAHFGYGDGDEVTTLRAEVDGVRSTTFYFRHRFQVPDPASVSGLTVQLVRDDGAMVYLNGQLVFRSNMPEGSVNASTLASEVVGGADESTFFPQAVDPAVLVRGENVLAVEVHQQNAGSSDVSFDLRLDALVSAANRAPTANAGPDVTAVAGTPIRLECAFTDDGLPAPPGVPSLLWKQSEGPAAATIAEADTVRPTVTFPNPGRYVLTFSVNDGASTVADTVVVTVSGGDGYEAWRERHFTAAERNDPAVSGDAADPDGDGQSNRAEYDSGTLPRDPTSVLRLRAVTGADGTLRLRASVVAGRTYTIQARDSVTGSAWTVLRHLDPGNCDCEVEVPLGSVAGSDPTQFYRLLTPRLP